MNHHTQMKTIHVLFLGEQDGAAERELKGKLVTCFSIVDEVRAAYLVRVSYTETPSPQIALCLRGGTERTAELTECIGKTFTSLFKTTEHLDILFLSETQLAEIERVAKPFFSQSA